MASSQPDIESDFMGLLDSGNIILYALFES